LACGKWSLHVRSQNSLFRSQAFTLVLVNAHIQQY